MTVLPAPPYDRHGPPCPHGSIAVCPHCDHRGFLIAYARTKNVIEHTGHTDEGIERLVDDVMASASGRSDDHG